MKRAIIVLLAALLLTGCSRQTQVWLPEEEAVELQGREVVRIPMDSETEPETTQMETEPAKETAPAETQPVIAGKTTISKKPTATPKKSSSTSTTKKETITATGKPVDTEPPATEPPVTEPPVYDIDGYRMGALEYEIFDRINEHRAEADLEALWVDEWLSAIASCRSFEISRVWSHTRPDGRHFATVLDDYGYGAGAVEELLIYDTGSGDGIAMADRWMESGSQRQLLLGDFTTAGIGVYRADGVTYVTCLLAK